ncbi:MAG: alpha/beta hydrolase [Ruminococcus sp.]|nr:alpha/beta hydrolase [Ruminococcus sp.]
MKKVFKITGRILLILLIFLLMFTLFTLIMHRVRTDREIALLKEKGYYNPVSVGEYSLNVAKFGNENGGHTIVSLSGLGMGDYSVAERNMTAYLEDDNLVVFVDRAGYGLSDDTDNEMTTEYIVEDYRKALENAGIEAPYILMAHSVGGAYATYWESKYPGEIEAVIFLDGSQLNGKVSEEDPYVPVTFGDKAAAFLAKLGFSRYMLRSYYYLYSDDFSDEQQKLADILDLMTMDSVAPVNEGGRWGVNCDDAYNSIVTNDIPKLYICASWGYQTAEEFNENGIWVNRMIEKNGLDLEKRTTDYAENDERLEKALEQCEKGRREIIYPYAEKLGNCEVVLLGGEHGIYEQRPDECGEIIKAFIDGLDS